jgi:O-antigen/teichoic acid export membrane protein
LMVISVLSAIINIIFNYFLIKKYGINGAAYSTVITQLIYFIIVYKVSLKHYFLTIDFKMVGLYFLGFGAVVFMFFKFVAPGWPGLIIKSVLIVATLLLVYYKQIKSIVLNLQQR